MRTPLRRLCFALALTGALPALAHTPYLMPNAFEPINDGLITLDASFAEHFFVPEVVFDGSQVEVFLPDGSKVAPDTLLALKTRLVIEHDLQEDGTYRFSTGRRVGRVFRFYELDGRTQAMEDENAPLPEGAKLVEHYQAITLAETYVTRGAPTDAALAPRGDGLEYVALSHPNDLFAGETLRLRALFHGEPLAGLVVEAFPTGRGTSDETPVVTLTSGSDGEFAFTPEAGGVYLLRSRYRSEASPDMAAPAISNTYTLVVEAAD
ncbi:MAG TPA: DUF4198 domain-containing protein [Hyphomicrobiales bacterium]|nr:DUF4198 domain-containing protein [Hyphomicrobiales bacterium]